MCPAGPFDLELNIVIIGLSKVPEPVRQPFSAIKYTCSVKLTAVFIYPQDVNKVLPSWATGSIGSLRLDDPVLVKLAGVIASKKSLHVWKIQLQTLKDKN